MLATLNQSAGDLGILKRQQALDQSMNILLECFRGATLGP